VDAGDHAVFVNQEGGGQGVYATVKLGRGIVASEDAVVHLLVGDVRLDDFPTFFIHGDAQDGEALVFKLLFKFYEPGDLYFAGTAPGGPEVEEDGFAFVFGEGDDFAVGVLEFEFRCLLALFGGTDAGGVGLGFCGARDEPNREGDDGGC
jgi:hypothetical protein